MSDLTRGQKPICAAMSHGNTKSQGKRLHIDWAVHAGAWSAFEPFEQMIVQITAEFDLVDLDWPAAKCEAALALSNDKAVHELNHSFRGMDKTTNVLSFPVACIVQPNSDDLRFIGDVIVASETVLREAQDRDLDPYHHLTHLIIHGILHLLGHDHEDPAEAAVMEAIEIRMLAGLGIGDPYGEHLCQ